MIQYKSWNSYSPLCADAAQWAMENKHLFPIGNINLYVADYASSKESVEIDLFDDAVSVVPGSSSSETEVAATPANVASSVAVIKKSDENDFEITAEELEGIEFVPTAQRMQTLSHGSTIKGNKLNFKTVLVKGLLWALIGAFIGFGISELMDDNLTSTKTVASLCGHGELVEYYKYAEKADAAYGKLYAEFEKWCKAEKENPKDEDALSTWLFSGDMSDTTEEYWEDYFDYDQKAEEALYDAYLNKYDEDENELSDALAIVTRTSIAIWSAIIALFIGLFLGIGEGIYYGSKEKAVKYALIGAGVSLAIGFISGYLAQWMYSGMLGDNPADFAAAFIRALGWMIMGLGIGVSVGLIKPEKKRILFCSLGGLVGAFIGGFLFNYVCDIIPNDVVARGIAIVIMGSLIGIGVGLLEQFAKAAWLKVIRGEFEGKEYLVFAGTTSIGNNGKNTIVLFKDKLVGPHHCDINLEGGKYVLTDCGTPMGTIVNGQKTVRHVLRQGDVIAIGNSVLVFNTK